MLASARRPTRTKTKTTINLPQNRPRRGPSQSINCFGRSWHDFFIKSSKSGGDGHCGCCCGCCGCRSPDLHHENDDDDDDEDGRSAVVVVVRRTRRASSISGPTAAGRGGRSLTWQLAGAGWPPQPPSMRTQPTTSHDYQPPTGSTTASGAGQPKKAAKLNLLPCKEHRLSRLSEQKVN